MLSAPFLAYTPYWLAAAYMHPPEEEGFKAIRARFEKANSPLIGVPDRGPLDRSVLRTLLSICKYYNVKIWHGHDYKSNLLGLMLRPFWSMKLVTTVHGWVKQTSRTPLYYAVDRWSLPYYHHVICVSDDLVEKVKSLNVPEERLTLIHNAIDEKTFARRFPASQSPLRQELNTPPGRLVIGAVGRLSAEKAFNLLIRAVHSLAGEGHDIECWIAGDGDARGELEKLIENLGMRGRVRLLGFRSDTVALYGAMDVFALSSLREGLPNVVLEAASMGVPIVSTKVAGVPKMLTDGQSGVLCEVGDAEALTRALRSVVSDADLRRRLAHAGRKLIEERYSFTQRMAKVRAIYDKVLGLPTPAPGGDTTGTPGALSSPSIPSTQASPA
ncbi:MAG: glycosyltransferase [Phycisphaera sp.]|nr:glycosyltransferase [Phycisphaera sp.]